MTLEQIKMLKESYMTEANRPDGSKSTTGEYMRFITDCNIEFFTSKDMVLMDDTNQAVHCVCYNEDAHSQSAFPVKIITAPYEDIHAVEAIMSQKNFEAFLEKGFFNNIEGFSVDKKNFMLQWSKSIVNKAQVSPHHIPFYSENKTPVVASVSDAASLVAAVTAGKSVTLAEDVELQDILELNGDCSINLNGKVLTSAEGKRAIKINGGNVTIRNGTIEAKGSGADAIFMNAIPTEGGSPCKLTIDKTATIIANDCCVFMKGEGAELNTEGTLHSTGSYAAIQGNGNAGGISVNVTGGMISAKDIAIYFPCSANLNISGNANIIGASAVYQKSGTMNISGDPVFIGNGEKADYKYNGNGANCTGDAVIIEACNYPDGIPVVNINGGFFFSTNANAIGYYQQSEEYKLANDKFINAGVFSSDVSAYVRNGKTCVKDGNKYVINIA